MDNDTKILAVLKYYFKDTPVDLDKMVKEKSIREFIDKNIAPESDKDPILKELLSSVSVTEPVVTEPVVDKSVPKNKKNNKKGWYASYMKQLTTPSKTNQELKKEYEESVKKQCLSTDSHNLVKM